MKTKVGKALLKQHNKLLDDLNKELIELSNELDKMDPVVLKDKRINSYGDYSYFESFLKKLKEIKIKRHNLLNEIVLIQEIELLLQDKKK